MSTPMQPPKRPKGESHKVTIANQDNQIRLLTQRVLDLTKRADDHEATASKWYHEAREKTARIQRLEGQVENLQVRLAEAAREIDYQRGYIARVKESDRQMFGPMPDTINLDTAAPRF